MTHVKIKLAFCTYTLPLIYDNYSILAYRHFDSTLPLYLSSKLKVYTLSRALRSSSTNLLSVSRVHLKSAGERSFSFQVPKVWNSLPPELRQSPSFASFKRNLKTYLFTAAFQNWSNGISALPISPSHSVWSYGACVFVWCCTFWCPAVA